MCQDIYSIVLSLILIVLLLLLLMLLLLLLGRDTLIVIIDQFGFPLVIVVGNGKIGRRGRRGSHMNEHDKMRSDAANGQEENPPSTAIEPVLCGHAIRRGGKGCGETVWVNHAQGNHVQQHGCQGKGIK